MGYTDAKDEVKRAKGLQLEVYEYLRCARSTFKIIASSVLLFQLSWRLCSTESVPALGQCHQSVSIVRAFKFEDREQF